jgi:4-hydroxybenzoate polyprenyl transferase
MKYIRLIRLNNPSGIFLLFLPCLFGVAASFYQDPVNSFLYHFLKPHLIILFFIGSIVSRSAGCIINDIFDRKFDALVERTKNRPLANGDVSIVAAVIILISLLAIDLFILLQLSKISIIIGLFLVLLIAIYPVSKRFTYYPQVILGLIYNVGIIIAAIEIHETVYFSTLLLYCAAVLWTIIYDCIYAFQDAEDDKKAGIKSIAIKFENYYVKYLSIIAFIKYILLVLFGYVLQLSDLYYLFSSIFILIIFWQIFTLNPKNSTSCMKKFKFNVINGFILLLGIILG